MYMHHETGAGGGGVTEETFASHRLKSQAINTIRVPPKIANLEQLSIYCEGSSLVVFFCHHMPTLEFKPSSWCKYKNDRSQEFMAIFC